MRKRWVYRNGCAIPVEVVPSSYGETIEPLEQRMVKNLYAMECDQGSRFNGVGEFDKGTLKKVWIDNVERDAAFDRRRDESLRQARERLGYDN